MFGGQVCSALISLYHSRLSVSQYYEVCRDDDIYYNIVRLLHLFKLYIVYCVSHSYRQLSLDLSTGA
jgi:hypothetical protein